MWVCSLRVKRGTGRAFSLTLAYCFIQTSEVEEQLNKRLHTRADQARLDLRELKNRSFSQETCNFQNLEKDNLTTR